MHDEEQHTVICPVLKHRALLRGGKEQMFMRMSLRAGSQVPDPHIRTECISIPQE